jgi:hypothetical protein
MATKSRLFQPWKQHEQASWRLDSMVALEFAVCGVASCNVGRRELLHALCRLSQSVEISFIGSGARRNFWK